jgi:hypothetical protein
VRGKKRPSAMRKGRHRFEADERGAEGVADAMESCRSLGVAEQVAFVIRSEGRVHLPLRVRESLGLEPGDFFAISRNPISLRCDLYRELLEDLQRSIRDTNGGLSLERFLRYTLVAVGDGGSLVIPPQLLPLHPGDRMVLEVAAEGLARTLYLYRAHD